MFRILKANKDTYITNKIIEQSRSIDSNVGQAGTLDLYKLYNETTLSSESGSIIELSRILISFDYSSLTTAHVSDVNFTASLVLKDVYGGQTTPSNFTLALYPLSKSFNEGRGSDIVSYKDLDTANFLYCSTGISWSITGANSLGNLGDDVDCIVSGDIGNGLEDFSTYCVFTRGDEDAIFDITKFVSASVAGILPNNGFRISFKTSEENDSTTRFVKRFGTRHAYNKALQPKINIELPDNKLDTSSNPIFNLSQSFYLYNYSNGNLYDYYSGSNIVNDLVLELISSKSINIVTSSFQANFNSIITHNSTSVIYFSQSFSGSKTETGIYKSDFILDTTVDQELYSFIDSKSEITFKGLWKFSDETLLKTDFYTFKKQQGTLTNGQEKNYVINVVNLKESYTIQELVRLKVFAQDLNYNQVATRYPTKMTSVIFDNMQWRLKKAFTSDIVIPFCNATKMSTDNEGMYFDLYVEDLDINEVYELEFLIKNNQNRDVVIQNKGFRFKVIA